MIMICKPNRYQIIIAALALAIAIPMTMGCPAAANKNLGDAPTSPENDAPTSTESDAPTFTESDAPTSAETDAPKSAELVDQLRKLRRQPVSGDTRDEQFNNYKMTRLEIIAITEQLYAQATDKKSADLPMAVLAVQARLEAIFDLIKLQDTTTAPRLLELAAQCEQLYKDSLADNANGLDVTMSVLQVGLQALMVAEQLDQQGATAKYKAFVNALSRDERPEIADIGKQLKFQLRFKIAPDADVATIARLSAELKQEFADREITDPDATIIMQFLEGLESFEQQELVFELYKYFADKFIQSGDEQLAQYGNHLLGVVRRLQLPGNPIEVTGKFFDGTDVDWSQYEGKVVLIDYWATWCELCLEELPNVLTNYEKYHDKGFEVIGISLDDERPVLAEFLEKEKLPWKTLFSDDPAASGWHHPMAGRYGISGIPMVFLVNQEGNVVSLNARGEELGRLLAELLGDDDQDATGGQR